MTINNINNNNSTIRNNDDANDKANRLHKIILSECNNKADIYNALSLMGVGVRHTEKDRKEKIRLLLEMEKRLQNNPEYSYSEIIKAVSQAGQEALVEQGFYQQYLQDMITKKQLGIAPNAMSAEFGNDDDEDNWLTV